MLQPLTKEQIKILEDYRNSGLGIVEFTKINNMKIHQLSYIIRKEKKLKEVIPNNEIVKLDTTSILSNDEEDDESSSSLSLTIGDININIQDNFDERLLTKVIKVCKDASRF